MTQTRSSQWVQLIDRGGLVHVTEEYHQLFVSFELFTLHHMRTNNLEMLGGGSRQHLINLIMLEDDVLFNWTMTGGGEEEVLKVGLCDTTQSLRITIPLLWYHDIL